MPAQGEVIISEQLCKGCGLCVHFCARECLSLSGGKMSAQGFVVPVMVSPEKCNACGICGRGCPDLAIEVYKCAS